MTPDSDVLAYGWEIACIRGNSDKFYRIIVFLDPEPGMVCLYGRRNAAGSANTAGHPTAEAAIAAATQRTREKEHHDYDRLTRGFTVFTVPARLAARDERHGNAVEISRLFAAAAAEQGHEEPHASSVS